MPYDIIRNGCRNGPNENHFTEDAKKTLPAILVLNYAMGETTMPMFFTTVPVVIAYLLLARNIIEGVQLGSVKM